MEQIDLYTDIFTESFINDPGVRWQFTGITDARRLFRALCRGELEAFAQLGLVSTIDGGLLIAFTSEQAQSAEFTAALSGSPKYFLQEATAAELALIQANASLLIPISQPDWYVRFVGQTPVQIAQIAAVSPRLRGRGLFRRLIAPVIEQCATQGRPLVLQTHNPDNVPLYEHFGFALLEQLPCAEAGVTCYNLLRRPGPLR